MFKNNKIVYVDYNFNDTQVEEKLFKEAGLQFINASEMSYEEKKEISKDALGVVSTYMPMDRDFIEGLDNCKVLVRTGIGFNTIDIDAASEKGIMVANVRDYCIEEVADHAIALSLSLIRRLPTLQKSIKIDKRWSVDDARPIERISTLTAGLYGIGAIGMDFAKKMKALGFNVVAYDPFVKDSKFEELGITKVRKLDDLFKLADVFSIHVPLNDKTRHSVTARELNMMKASAYIINVSRGEIIKETDLTKALKDGIIAGAGLDVLESENPNLNDELFQLDNVIITPHVAYYSEGSEQALQELSAKQAILAVTEGEPTYFVNKNSIKL